MDLIIQKASIKDIDKLLGLYVSVYGDDYPLEIGTNKTVMSAALKDPERFLWLVMRDQEKGIIAGSAIVEMDLEYRIGKVTGVAVSESYRGQAIGEKLIAYAVDIVLNEQKKVNSLYATGRMVSMASQKMLFQNGFLPLGIFPNARKIKTYESLALVGTFAPHVLERRAEVSRIPEALAPIVKLSNEIIKSDHFPKEVAPCKYHADNRVYDEFGDHFEFIQAPNFVKKRFDKIFGDDEESVFYPFHQPNLIIASEKTDLELFAFYNKKDHYCVLITSNEKIGCLRENMKKLFFQMKEHGIYYVETLVRLDYFDTLCFLTENRFIPSAIYPAMREEDGMMHDYILLTRTMIPLDFSDAQIHPSLNPYVKQYAKKWIHQNLSIVEGVE